MTVYTRCGKVRATECARRPVRTFTHDKFIAFCIFFFSMSLTAANAEPTKTMFDIEQGPAKWSLTLYAQQAQVPLGFSVDIVGEIFTNPVKGEYDNEQALELLLKGTGLEVEYGERGIIIRQTQVRKSGSGIEEPTPTIAKTNSLQLTQTTRQVATQTPPASADSNNSEKVGAPPVPTEEIVVTGTQIRGVGAAGANVITIDRAEIELTGLATTQEILQSIPQNFGGGANEVTQNIAVGAFVPNAGFASGVNLRGLGTESTLLLVNGRRSAPGGGIGSFVDLNSIPATAIERVEVLADGASAIYGSDAVGGVINVILRDDYEGAETRLRYAPGTSDIDEVQFSQVFGKRWESGNVLFTYEYYDRSELKSEDRVYTKDSNLTNLGGVDHSVDISNPGNIIRYTLSDGTNMNVQFAIPEGQDGMALTPADLFSGVTNLQNTREGSTVLPSQERHSASLLLSQEMSDTIELFADARYSTRDFENRSRGITSHFAPNARLDVPSINPFFVDPFGGSTALRINYSFLDDYGAERSTGTVDTLGATLGATFDLNNSWQLDVYGSYNTENTDTRRDRRVNTALLTAALADPDPTMAFNPFGEGSNTNPVTLAAIEGFASTDTKSELVVFNVRADGELFDLPGGASMLAIGAQFNDQTLESSPINFLATPKPVPGAAFDIFNLDRDVTAAYVEVYLPFVTEANRRPGIRELAFSIAGRYEDYSDFGDTFNPKFGVSWSPTGSLKFRSTYGTSFRAPLLAELDDSARIFQGFSGVPDPASPTGVSNVIFSFGNNPDLIPEEGTTWTAGFDVEPETLSDFSVGLTYFETEIDNLIQVPTTNLFQPLNEPEAFAAIIQRVPGDVDVATVAEILSDPACFFCAILFTADDINAIVDSRLNNLNKMELSGIDLEVAYAFDTDVGAFNLLFYASHLLDFKEQPFASGPLEDQLDTFDKPNSLKLRSSLSWSNGGLHATVFGNHIGDYTSDFDSTCKATVEGFCRVSSWTTWDLNVGYDFGERYSRFLETAKLSLNVRNIFDTNPPFVEIGSIGVGFDPHAANPLGRFLAFQIIKAW